MITLKQLAEKSNVSIATVSNIINGKSNVSEETKQRVFKIIEQTGYEPNFMARGLRANKSNTIAIIVEDLCAFHTRYLVEGIMSQCEVLGYRVVIENLRYYEKFPTEPKTPAGFKKTLESAINQMIAIRVDAIIYVAAYSREDDYFPDNVSVPVIIAYDYNPKISSVTIDDVTAAFEMTDYLINKGCSSIAIISGIEGNIHSVKRIEGYKLALKKHNLSFNDEIVINGDWNRVGGYEACKKLSPDFFENKQNAIFCFNDEMAAGVYDFLSEKKLVPGKDISVTGFDNQEFSTYMQPKLTTMEIPLKEIGMQAAEQAVKKINGTEDSIKFLNIPCRLIKRESD